VFCPCSTTLQYFKLPMFFGEFEFWGWAIWKRTILALLGRAKIPLSHFAGKNQHRKKFCIDVGCFLELFGLLIGCPGRNLCDFDFWRNWVVFYAQGDFHILALKYVFTLCMKFGRTPPKIKFALNAFSIALKKYKRLYDTL